MPHGSAWDLYSGSGLNAIGGLSRDAEIPKARYDQHQFGFTAGGPIVKDRLFGFGAAQWSGLSPSTFSMQRRVPVILT